MFRILLLLKITLKLTLIITDITDIINMIMSPMSGTVR